MYQIKSKPALAVSLILIFGYPIYQYRFIGLIPGYCIGSIFWFLEPIYNVPPAKVILIGKSMVEKKPFYPQDDKYLPLDDDQMEKVQQYEYDMSSWVRSHKYTMTSSFIHPSRETRHVIQVAEYSSEVNNLLDKLYYKTASACVEKGLWDSINSALQERKRI